MRIYEKGYNYYGITEEEYKQLRELCARHDFANDVQLLASCKLANEEIAVYLFYSLKTKTSYDSMRDIPINKHSFYGYRRCALANFKAIMDCNV